MVHPHRVYSVFVGFWTTPVILFVVLVSVNFIDRFFDNELGCVFDVIGSFFNRFADLISVPVLFIESVDFVSDSSCF